MRIWFGFGTTVTCMIWRNNLAGGLSTNLFREAQSGRSLQLTEHKKEDLT